MDELVLTEERRNVLAALLNDDARLRVEYPKVDDYLDVALRLPGTGNEQIDRAFDLRFVHYVTGGSAESPNPYWDIVEPFVRAHDGRRAVNGGRPDGSARMAYGQKLLQAIYAYAIPSPETMEWMSGFCAGRPVLELGAGRGYWAAQLARSGLKIEAYDSMPPGKVENVSFPSAAGQVDAWHHVGDISEFENNAVDRSDSVLLLCWPPGWGDTMASEALAAFEKLGGQRMVYIGQQRGGMTGNDAFFEALSTGWKRASEDAQYVSWWNLADVAEGWVRR